MDLGNLGIAGIFSASFLLGAMHSLEPGHGKTVVAAYLVGSRGKNVDAVILGLVVTFTHTFSIITLGVAARLTSRYFSEQTIHAWLGILASLIILGIGLWMLKTRWAALNGPGAGHHRHSGHSHSGHGHSHHHHEEGTLPSHGHHSHEIVHIDHDGHGRKPVGLWGLILLGISGGIVPCPAALAILLAAVSVGDIGKGLALVVVFSLGLAAALVAIGLVVVNGVRAARKFVETEKFAPMIAFVSAVIVTLIGAYTLYSSVRHIVII